MQCYCFLATSQVQSHCDFAHSQMQYYCDLTKSQVQCHCDLIKCSIYRSLQYYWLKYYKGIFCKNGRQWVRKNNFRTHDSSYSLSKHFKYVFCTYKWSNQQQWGMRWCFFACSKEWYYWLCKVYTNTAKIYWYSYQWNMVQMCPLSSFCHETCMFVGVMLLNYAMSLCLEI